MRSSVALAVAAASLMIGEAHARFAPPLGRPIRQTLSEERSDGARTQRFTVERQLTFAAAPDGYILDVVTERISHSDGATGAMFASGMSVLIGRSIRFRLAADGSVTGVDDETALWSAICDRIDVLAQTTAAASQERRTGLRSMGAVLRALSPARRREVFTSLVSSLVAGPLAERKVGDQQIITVPGSSVGGVTATLSGIEQVQASPDRAGQSIIVKDVRGEVPVPNAPPGQTARLHIASTQQIDRDSGLVVASVETRETTIGLGDSPRNISKTIMQLDPMVF